MKVVLREDVDTLGHKGDLVDVADGYARNFLVPRGLAMKATKGVVAQAESMRRNRSARDERERADAQEVAARLDGKRIPITARAGDGGKLFGSITSVDVAEALATTAGSQIDRKALDLTEPLKELGDVAVAVRLHPDVTATVTIEVVAG